MRTGSIQGTEATAAGQARSAPTRVLVCGGPGVGKSTVAGALAGAPQLQLPGALLDPPGADRYFHHLVSAALTANAAVLVLDDRGLTDEARHDSRLVSTLGLRELTVAVNKMDLAGYDRSRFEAIVKEYRSFATDIGLAPITYVPICAQSGENVLEPGPNMNWQNGPPLIGRLEAIDFDHGAQAPPFRMAVQSEQRDDPDQPRYDGVPLSGTVKPGDQVVVSPAGHRSTVKQVESEDDGQRIAVTLSGGTPAGAEVLADAASPPGVADQFEATIVWLGSRPMLPGRTYTMRIGAKELQASITPLKYKLRFDSPEHVAATKLELGEIGICDLECSEPIVFDRFRENRETGRFAVIDRIRGDLVGIGLIQFALRRSHNVRWQPLTIDRPARARALQQQPTALWFTGLSGAGKSTIANLVEGELHRRGHHTYMLDGDNVRHGLNADLGFTDADRVENIRRVSEVTKLMVDAGLIVLVSFISPFRAERAMARSLFADHEFLEVYVDTPLAVAEERDTKGLYAKARRGDLVNFTGIDSPYEPPERAEIHLHTTELSASDAAVRVIELLDEWGRLGVRD